MPHELTLLTTITAGFVAALLFGLGANRIGLPPLVGYLVAGVALGPFSPGFVADATIASELSEIGVILLMFGVGLHFSVSDLLAVRRIAIPGAIGQIFLATCAGVCLAWLWGWTFGAGLVFGLSVSVASTVVLLKALEEGNSVGTPNSRIAVGWLIVEDLVMVLALVLLPAFAEALGGHAASAGHDAGHSSLALTATITLVKVAAFVALALIVGPRFLPRLLLRVARSGSRELFTLSVLAIALGIAFGSAKLFGVSFALGAFFAGMVLSESDFSHRAATNSLPLQDAFSVLFFVSVGMLFDPSILLRHPGMVLSVVFLIVVGKSLCAFAIVLLLKYPLTTALVVSAALAQIGEFSFILGGIGVRLGLLPQEGLNLILAGALLSITLNSFVFSGAEKLGGWLGKSPRLPVWLGRFGERRFTELQTDLDAARERSEQKAAAHLTLNPMELAERFPLFSGLTLNQREVLLLYFQAQSADPGERIVRAGDASDAVYFLSSGKVEAVFPQRRFALETGDYFGEIELLEGQPRMVDVIALDYSKLLKLRRRDFLKFLRKFPEAKKQIDTAVIARKEAVKAWLEETV